MRKKLPSSGLLLDKPLFEDTIVSPGNTSVSWLPAQYVANTYRTKLSSKRDPSGIVHVLGRHQLIDRMTILDPFDYGGLRCKSRGSQDAGLLRKKTEERTVVSRTFLQVRRSESMFIRPESPCAGTELPKFTGKRVISARGSTRETYRAMCHSRDHEKSEMVVCVDAGVRHGVRRNVGVPLDLQRETSSQE